MTTPRDPDRRLRAYLDDGPTELPARSYDALDARIARTHQRAGIGPWRNPLMSNLARAAAVATVAILVVVAMAIVRSPSTGPAASPSVVPSPSPTPAPSPLVYRWPGRLAAGTYDTSLAWDQGLVFHFTVGDGWDAADINIARSDRAGLWFFPIRNVASDVCSRTMPERPIVTPEVVVTALDRLVDFDAAPLSTQIGGRDARYVEFTIDGTTPCAGVDPYTLFALPDPTCPPDRCTGVGPPFMGLEFGSVPHHERLWVMTVGRSAVAVAAIWTDAATPAELSALQDVIDSFRLDTPLATPAPSASSG